MSRIRPRALFGLAVVRTAAATPAGSH